METRKIHDMEFSLDLFDAKTVYVHIAIAGTYWDSREFPSLGQARAFLSDPLAEDRQACERKAKREAEREAAQWPVWERDPTIWS